MAELIGQQSTSSVMRAREVRERLSGKIDPQLQYVLEAIAEQTYQAVKWSKECVQMVDQMATITQSFVGVAENMKAAYERLNPPEDGLGAVTK